MIFLYLFITFFEIGIFGFGGGYGMLSLIQHETVEHWHWLSSSEFTDIVAISQMTPGPIGINSATYCGYTAIYNAGYGHWVAVLGSATATFALVLPSLILMILISSTRENFNTPQEDLWQFCISCLLFVASFYGVKVIKINPIHMILYSAVAGLVLLY